LNYKIIGLMEPTGGANNTGAALELTLLPKPPKV